MAEERPKRCRDCRYFGGEDFGVARCGHPDAVRYDRIGDNSQELAVTMRERSCGYDAVLFEPQITSPDRQRHLIGWGILGLLCLGGQIIHWLAQ